MSSVPDCVLSWGQWANANNLPDRATILRQGARTRGPGAGVIAGTPTEITDVPCRIESVGDGGDIYEIASRLQLKAPMVFKFAISQVIVDGDEFHVGSDVYKVRWIKPVTALSVLKTVLVDKV